MLFTPTLCSARGVTTDVPTPVLPIALISSVPMYCYKRETLEILSYLISISKFEEAVRYHEWLTDTGLCFFGGENDIVVSKVFKPVAHVVIDSMTITVRPVMYAVFQEEGRVQLTRLYYGEVHYGLRFGYL